MPQLIQSYTTDKSSNQVKMFSFSNSRFRVATIAHLGVFLLAFLGVCGSVANGAAVTRTARINISAVSNITSRQGPPENVATGYLNDGSNGLTLDDITCNGLGSGEVCLTSIQQAAYALIAQFASECYQCGDGASGIITGSPNDNTNGVAAAAYYFVTDATYLNSFISYGVETYYDGAGVSYGLYLGGMIADSIRTYQSVMLCAEFYIYEAPFLWMGMAFGWNGAAFAISDDLGGEFYNTCGGEFGYVW